MPVFETGIITGTTPTTAVITSLTRSDGQPISGAPPANTALAPDPYYSGGYCLAFLDTTPQPIGLTYSGTYRLTFGGVTVDQSIPPFPVNPTEIDLVVAGATTVNLTNIVPLPAGTAPATLFSGGNLILPSPFIGGQLGIWALPLTDATLPAPPAYQYTWTSNGTPAGPTLGLLNVPVPAIGAWGSTRANLQRVAGTVSEQIYADADNTGNQATIIQLEQGALDEADTRIQSRLATNNLANTPLTVTGAYQVGQLKLIETYWAVVGLCEHRGRLAAKGSDVWGAMLLVFDDKGERLMKDLVLASMNRPLGPNSIPPDSMVQPSTTPQFVRQCVMVPWGVAGSWSWGWWGGAGWGFAGGCW